MWILYLLPCLCVALLAIVLFLIAPRRKRDISPFDRTLYAHRGLHNNHDCPENSLAAFKAAKEAGYGVEFDVRFTADKQVVVFHDDTLLRMCGDSRRVDECTYEQLQQLSLSGTDQKIPLLSDVLEMLDNTTILCEIKPARSYFDTSLCDETNKILTAYKAHYCIESFNPFSVRWFRKNTPQVVRGILSKQYTKGEIKPNILCPLLSSLMTSCLCRPDFIAYQHTDAKQPFFRLCRQLGSTTIAWTIRSVQEQAYAGQHFDTAIFEGYTPNVDA